VLVILARDLDPSVFLGAGWFVLAWLVHRLALRDRDTEEDVSGDTLDGP
jgi:hypothetical protein